MDLIALACQEVGLDLTEAAVEVIEVTNQDEWRLPWQDDNSQEGWPLSWEEESRAMPERGPGMVLHKQLSFGGDFSNTVFTDQEGKESAVDLQFDRPSSTTVGSSPVTNLYSQRKPNFLPRRSRTSQVAASIQGAPCRNLPELPSAVSDLSKQKSRSEHFPVLEVPSLAIQPHHVEDDNNPFLHLFQDTRPGQVAFAFYVSDCWASFSVSSVVPDQDQFVSQCERWWLNLPTPYRRGYWTREVEYKSMTRRVTGGEGREKVMVVANEKGVKKQLKNTNRVEDSKEKKKQSPPKKMMTAFKHFLAKYKSMVGAEMAGATGREVRNELGKRWKALSDCDKEKFFKLSIDKEKELGGHVDEVASKSDEQIVPLKCENEVFTDEHQHDLATDYEIKVEQTIEDLLLDDDTLNDDVNSKEDINAQYIKSEMTINLTLEEIEQFAIEAKFYIEEESFPCPQNLELELSSPERNVIELMSDLSKIEFNSIEVFNTNN